MAGADGVVRFRILGPLEVWTGEGWSGIGAPKWRALLAALLLNPGQVVSTDRLIAELWGDDPPDRAANLVSVYVLRLRRVLGDPEGRVLTTRAPGYQLLLGPGELDAGDFEALAGQGREALAAGDSPRAAGVLAEALGLWRGRALADVPSTALITAEAGRLEESRLAALELRMEADLGCGRHAGLVAELRRLLSDQPLREGLWSLLIRALGASGRRAEALAAYGQAREVISDELGVDPGPELQRLYQAMLTADRVARRGPPAAPEPGGPRPPRPASRGPASRGPASRGPASPGPASPGPGSPIPGSPGSASPAPAATPRGARAASPRRVPAQLPADVADFTGRDTHLERLRGLLSQARRRDSPAVAVAVVAGAPGLGKSALAVHAAHALRPDFPDGQLYVSLLGGSEQPVPPDEALARFLRDLGVDGARVPVEAEERAAMYRTRLAERQMLAVLDDARDAAQVRPLLPGTGSCAVIVTSRHRLSDLVGSQLVDLEVLNDSEAAELFTRIIGAERAEAEPGPVRDVLAACAGLPLAIRIAGARLTARRSWSVRTLADRLADQRRRMDEFTAGDLAVRAAFRVSFDALQRPASRNGIDPARVFRLLGTWQGASVGLPAAAALIGEPENPVADALEVLVDANLLDSPAPDRYRLHDLLRAFAVERAEADEAPQAIEEAVHRVLSWYLRTADAAACAAAPYLDRVPLGPAEPGVVPLVFASAEQALDWCDRERANLVAATRQAASHGLHDIAWKLPAAMKVCLDRLGYRTEWLTTHRIALASARELGDRTAEAWVLTNLGMVLGQQRAQDAVGYFEQALAIYRETGDQRYQAQVANNLAFCYLLLGRHEEAVAALLGSLDLQRRVGRRYGEGVALCNLGEAYVELGRHDQAIAVSQEALAIAREVGSVRDEGYALHNLGRAHLELGHLAEAANLFEQALSIHRAAGDRSGEAQDLQRIGTAHARAGRPAEAHEVWNRARIIFEGLGEDSQAAELGARLEQLDAGP
ncbi:MAG TPA: BTAD domain-containing putative transcriptional regulator [Streptosporangiaceae bacterium]|nr:BTAD domain-containing putative transcriptional regulator [Streptosporangiaceae bacterium]